MKEFRKNKDGFYVCEECKHLFKSKVGLGSHVVQIHKDIKEYFDKWIKNETDGKCKICGDNTEFLSIGCGYKNCCSKKCGNEYRDINKKKALVNKYGAESIFLLDEFKEKIKKIFLDRYGAENSFESKEIREKIKQTCLERFGVENPFAAEEIKEKIRQTNLERFGVENPFQSEEIKEKIRETWISIYGLDRPSKSMEIKNKVKQTCLERFGVEYSLQSIEVRKKGKQTRLKLYGDENYRNPEKYKQTCLERFGVEHAAQSKETKEKTKRTCLEKYGCESPMQVEEIFLKQQKSLLIRKQYKDTNLYYQGSYELDFLEKYYDKIEDLEKGHTIKYKYKGKNKVYYPDFYSPSLNLIIEIKSTWILNGDKKNMQKKKYTIKNGYNYIMILDKDYKEFESLIENKNHR
jgi:hypothetical protein